MKKSMPKFLSIFLMLTLLVTVFALPVSARGADVSPNKPPTATTTTEKEGEEEESKEINPFDLPRKKIAALYTARSGKFTVSPIRKDDPDVEKFAELISSIDATKKPAHIDEMEAAESIEASFLVIRTDGERSIFTLNKNNRIMDSIANGYTIPAETYNSLLEMYNKDRKDAHFLQWIIYIQPGNVKDISYELGDGKTVSMKEAGYLNEAMQLVRGTRAANATSEESYDPYETTLTPGDGVVKVTIHFEDDEGNYFLNFAGNTLYLQADGYHIGRKYTTAADEGTRIINALKDPVAAFGAKTAEKAA